MGAKTLRLADEQALQELVARTRGVSSYVGSAMKLTDGGAPPGARPHLPAKPREAKPLKVSEDELQMICFELVEAMRGQYPILEWVVHVPNGGKRHLATAGRLKAMGVKKGVLDIMLPLPYNGWAGFAIELKVGRNTTTAEQDDWLAVLTAAGYYTGTAYSLEEFEGHLKHFLSARSSHSVQDAALRLGEFLRDRRSRRSAA